MKIECIKEYLLKAVAKAEKITAKNQTLPILSTILLAASNNQLTLKATNLDLGIIITIPVKIIKEGEVALSAQLLHNYLSSVTTKNISLEVKGDVCELVAARNKATLKTFNHDDFPIIPIIPKEQVVSIPTQDFIAGLKAVWYAASVSSMKPELSSVYIHYNDGKLVFVATDSFRLAEKQIAVTLKGKLHPLLIPHKNIPEIIRVLEDEDTVDLLLSKNQIAFENETLYLTSRIVEGNFPDYRQIIPKEATSEVTVLKDDLAQTIKLKNYFVDKFNQISFSLNVPKKQFEIRAKNTDMGESSEFVPGVVSGQNLDIHFNSRYIADSFQSLHADSITLSFAGLQKPLVIRGVTDPSFMYLVMPMNR